MLLFHINPHSGLPVYRQIMDQVKHYVASGLLKPGEQLPSIRLLAQTLSVNPTTIVKAYSELTHEGVIEMRHGRGVFVSESKPRLGVRRQEEALRPLTRQLAIEALQLGAHRDTVLKWLNEEFDSLEGQDS